MDLCLRLLGGVRLAAPLQQHVERVLHALAQVAGAARRQQGAQLEGFGNSLLIDVGQHVLFSLAAKDDLGVVVVEVDLWEGKRNGLVNPSSSLLNIGKVYEVGFNIH